MNSVDTIPGMGKEKKKSNAGRKANPANQGQASIYVEVDPWLKKAMEQIAAKNRRSVKAQLTIEFERIAMENGIGPPGSDDDDE